jgi:methylated-DNA-[protein]-cysteine S-methyltransferase
MVAMEQSTKPPVTVVDDPSPIGPLALALCDGVLCGMTLDAADPIEVMTLARLAGPVRRASVDDLEPPDAAIVAALDRYFAGNVGALDEIAVRAVGTPFQQHVWDALRRIPAGETCSYAELARVVGTPNAPRAVGRANATNPVPIVVPCHRVIRADGSLGGYGGGLERKRWLLQHERVHTADLLSG